MITSAGLRVFPRPAAQRYEGWFARSFAEGADALRRLVQAGIEPDVARLSDEAETRMSLALGGTAADRPGRAALLRARGYGGGCLLICGWEDAADAIARRRRRRRECCDARARCRSAAAGAGLARRPLRRPAPARRPARPRRARRDARDRDDLVEPRGAARRRDAGARGRAGGAARRLPRLPPLRDGRLAVLHGARGAGPRRSARSVARGEGAPRPTRSSRPAARSRTTTRSAPTTRPGWPAEVGPLGHDLLRMVKERCDPAG